MKIPQPQHISLRFIALLIIIWFSASITPHVALAQTAPFLITPYTDKATITQGWTSAFEPNHHAYDFALNYQTIVAAEAGTVAVARWNTNTCHNYSGTDPNIGLPCGFGLFVRIDHSNGHSTYYAHLSATAFALTTAGTASVQAGQIIGTSGNTGWSTGAHLHFELRNNGNTTQIDPFTPNLWKDGEWATPSRPIPAPVNNGETQINETTDNTGGFTKGNGGYPNNVCANNCTGWTYDSNMYYASSNGSTENRWARWLPGLPVSDAFYEVMVFIPNVAANTTTWQAPYTIIHADGTSTAVVDQVGSTNRWISIGTYRMQTGNSVYVTDASGETANTRRIGVDAVKFIRRGTVYAPDVRYSNSGGMTSALIIRNNGGGPATYQAKFMNSDGTNACLPQPYTLAAHQTTSVICGNSLVAAAMIESNQDLSVLVRSFATGVAMLDNAFMSSTTGDPAFERTATTLYVPAIYNNIFSGLNSTVHVQNTTSNWNNVTLTYKPRAGYLCNPCSTSFTLLGRGKLAQVASTVVGGNAWTGSLVITAQYPVAVKVEESQGGAIERSFNALASGGASIYVPAAYKNKFMLNSGLVIQNLHQNNDTTVTLTYCNRPGSGCVAQTLTPVLPPLTAVGVKVGASTVLTNSWTGSIRVDGSGGIPLGVAVTNARTDFPGGYDFNGSNRGSRVVVLPRAVKNTNGITTGYTVRNVSGQAVTVVARYYNTNGTFAWSRTFTINIDGVEGFHQSNDNVGNSWAGSIVLSATDNIIAIMREDTASTVAGYNGIPR